MRSVRVRSALQSMLLIVRWYSFPCSKADGLTLNDLSACCAWLFGQTVDWIRSDENSPTMRRHRMGRFIVLVLPVAVVLSCRGRDCITKPRFCNKDSIGFLTMPASLRYKAGLSRNAFGSTRSLGMNEESRTLELQGPPGSSGHSERNRFNTDGPDRLNYKHHSRF